MKKKLTLLLVLAGICILAAVALILLLRPADTDIDELYDNEEIAHDHEHFDNYIENEDDEMLLDASPDTVKQVTLTNDGGVFTIRRDKKTADLYIDEIDRSIPICSDYLEYVWCYAHSLGYNGKIISTSDMPLHYSDFGLDKPSASLDVILTDGNQFSYDIGSELTGDQDVYYFKFGDTVYISEFSLALFQGEGYFIDTDFFGLQNEENDKDVSIGKMTISGGSEKKLVLEPFSTDDRSDRSYSSDYIITSPIKTAIDNENVTALVNELTYLSADSALCSSPDKVEKEKYGLDKPSKVIRFERNGTDETVYLGNVIDGNCYIMIGGIDVIYTLEQGNYESMLAASLSSLRSSVVCAYTIDGVDRIEVSFGGNDYLFTAQRKPLDEKSSYYEYHAFTGKDSKELDIAYYKRYLSLLSSAGVSGWDTKVDTDSAPELTINVSYFDEFGRKDEKLAFYSTGQSNYLCCVNGKPYAQVSHIWINQIKKGTVSLSENKAVTA